MMISDSERRCESEVGLQEETWRHESRTWFQRVASARPLYFWTRGQRGQLNQSSVSVGGCHARPWSISHHEGSHQSIHQLRASLQLPPTEGAVTRNFQWLQCKFFARWFFT